MARSTRAASAPSAVRAQQTCISEAIALQLETLRSQAIYQNTIDTWIALCEERDNDWYNTTKYKAFIRHLIESGISIKKFPLCIKEAGGEYSRGRDKTTFAEDLESRAEDHGGNNLAAAYTVKLSDSVLGSIRAFSG